MYTACNFISELEWRCLEWHLVKCALREKCPNTEFFMVRILPHSDWIRRVTEYLSVFSPNARKYGPEKSPYLDTFHAVVWRNSILYEIIKFDIKHPNLINSKIISSLSNRSKLSKRYYSNPAEENKSLLTTKSSECSNMFLKAKERYATKLSKELDDPSTITKAYCSILNTLLNNTQIPNVPLLNVNGKVISNFDKKLELFNLHFTSQKTPINNSSVIPPLVYETNGGLRL